jgi:5-methylcytosine-specific restriction endonuclease McrA
MTKADGIQHGTRSAYCKGGCRCDECRAVAVEYIRKWRAANPDKVKAAARRDLEITRAWQKVNPEKVREAGRRYYAAHPEERRAVAMAYARANPERVRANMKAWSKANPDKVAKNGRARRARLAAADVRVVTERDWRRLIARFDHRCAYCGVAAPLAQEHVIPLSRGGRHAIGNLLPVCRFCNTSKHKRLLVEWRFKQRSEGVKWQTSLTSPSTMSQLNLGRPILPATG